MYTLKKISLRTCRGGDGLQIYLGLTYVCGCFGGRRLFDLPVMVILFRDDDVLTYFYTTRLSL